MRNLIFAAFARLSSALGFVSREQVARDVDRNLWDRSIQLSKIASRATQQAEEHSHDQEAWREYTILATAANLAACRLFERSGALKYEDTRMREMMDGCAKIRAGIDGLSATMRD